MKFGLESEKFIFNLRKMRPSNGVFSFLDALSDYHLLQDSSGMNKATNEFVLNMVELGSRPSPSPMEVLKDYLFNHLLLQSVALRERVALVPLGSLPMDFQPQMIPKWSYFVQNSILDQKRQESWMMDQRSPLRAAGNCAGMHIHIEVSTPPEFLFLNRELQNKFNMGLMMTPMIAFSSSPYFFGHHSAQSMRGKSYYHGVYRHFPLNGGLPPVMDSSIDVLKFTLNSTNFWINQGVKLGFERENMMRLLSKKGANWNPLRWNRQWNTLEIRCFDSDRIDLDAAKFIWVSNAMKRMDIRGEALNCSILKSRRNVDNVMIDDCFDVRGKSVTILPTHAIHELFNRAIQDGVDDPLVERYLYRLKEFAQNNLDSENSWAFKILKKVLDSHITTSKSLLEPSRYARSISIKKACSLVEMSINEQDQIINRLRKFVPDVFTTLDELELRF